MYFSFTRHESIRKVSLRRPTPTEYDKEPALEVSIYSRETVWLSMSVTEAAAVHEALGKALERAKAATAEETGDLLVVKF